MVNSLVSLFYNNPNKPKKYFTTPPTPQIDNYVPIGHMMPSPTHRMFPSLFLSITYPLEKLTGSKLMLFFLETHTSQTKQQEICGKLVSPQMMRNYFVR